MTDDDERVRAKVFITPDIAPESCAAIVFHDMADRLLRASEASRARGESSLQTRIAAMKCTIASQRISGIDGRHHFDHDPELREHAHAYGARLDELERQEAAKPVPVPFSGQRFQSKDPDAFNRSINNYTVCPICGERPASIVGYVHVVYDHEAATARFSRCDEPVTFDDCDPRDGGWWPVGASCETRFPRAYVEHTLPSLAREPIGPLFIPPCRDPERQ